MHSVSYKSHLYVCNNQDFTAFLALQKIIYNEQI